LLAADDGGATACRRLRYLHPCGEIVVLSGSAMSAISALHWKPVVRRSTCRGALRWLRSIARAD
jgi:hypothetical protein